MEFGTFEARLSASNGRIDSIALDHSRCHSTFSYWNSDIPLVEKFQDGCFGTKIAHAVCCDTLQACRQIDKLHFFGARADQVEGQRYSAKAHVHCSMRAAHPCALQEAPDVPWEGTVATSPPTDCSAHEHD